MTTCPICQRSIPPDALKRHPYLWPEALTLAKRINPDWTPADGLCSLCFDSLMEATEQARTQQKRLDAQNEGFRGYYRYHLTRRELVFWNHRNADIRRWQRDAIFESASERARAAGFDAWLIFDGEEMLVAQGVSGSQRW